ncbi:MFS transporter [Xylanimonas protaetiae]|uniref:MFS transporter n=1 Tax=Xylanimonas protaetiae TaxID=2509457 RepID=A0A4P6F316_9MICO|nr:MFS transporter [Xylanimonas protaetiae]QAY69133.1 MFS transporter [Xylanimonas protaetiae]
MASTFSSLRYPNYRIWFGAALVANVGTWMQRVGQDWVVLTQLTHNSGTAVGFTTALQFLPFLLLSPYAGLLADRLPRRKLLMATQGAMGLLAFVLAALTLTNTVQLWQLYVLAFLTGVASAIDSPVRQTFVAEMVPADKLPNAIGLNSASFNAARLIGPGVAGLLVAAVGAGWVFLINGISFAATIAALAAMDASTLRTLPVAPRSKGQIREAVRFVRGRSDIVLVMTVMAVVSMFGLNFQLTSALMARVEFGKGAGEYGVLGSVLAIGSLAGALLAARRDRPRVRLVLGAGFAFAAATTLNALMPTYVAFAVTAIPVGLASLTMMTAANATLQTSVDPVMRGRVMALYMMVFQGATPIGSPLVGWIGQVAGPRWAILSGSIATFAVVSAVTVWAVRNWKVKLEPHLHPRPHLDVVHPVRTPVAMPDVVAA